MKKIEAEYVIVGGGPSGLGAAYALMNRGEDFLLLETNDFLGGSLRFLMDPKLSSLGDPTVALYSNLREIKESIEVLSDSTNVMLNTTALDITKNEVIALSKKLGLVRISYSRAIIATGSRDATSWEMLIVGRNVYGIYTTRLALGLLLENVLFGREVVVYGGRPLTRFLVTIIRRLEEDNKAKLKAIVVEENDSDKYPTIPNLQIGKVLSVLGDKRVEKIIILTGSDETSIDCDSLVIGAQRRGNDYILKRSNIEYESGDIRTKYDNIILCGELIKDFNYLDEPFYECKDYVKRHF